LDDALDLARRAAERTPSPAAERILGLVAYRRGNHEKAVAHLDKANHDADVLEGLVRSCLALGRLLQAEQRAEAARQLAATPAGLRRACDLLDELTRQRVRLYADLLRRGRPVDRAVAADAIGRFLCAELAHVA